MILTSSLSSWQGEENKDIELAEDLELKYDFAAFPPQSA